MAGETAVSMTILLPFLIMAVGYSISEYLPLQYRMAMVSGYRQYGAIVLYGFLYIAGWAGFVYLALSSALAAVAGGSL